MYGNDNYQGAAAAAGQINMAGRNGAMIGLKEQEPRQAEVPAQLQKLEKALAYCEDSVRELLNRLEPLVRPMTPEPATSGNQLTAVGPSTNIGAELQQIGGRTYLLAERVQDVLRRLEV